MIGWPAGCQALTSLGMTLLRFPMLKLWKTYYLYLQIRILYRTCHVGFDIASSQPSFDSCMLHCRVIKST
ncbi:hypothetical protein HZ326_17849 [Fusarium oxysporum f. sp. albedinis]|nr:hypothetical protein HZ326_17849 [Fusarium oxysporum f. sp. albedinis]